MKKKILIVDDDPRIVELLSLRLRKNNYDVITAYDGYECVQLSEIESPDLILLDIKMPRRGGIGAFEILKSTHTTEMIPVIFITAFPDPEINRQVIKMGAKDLISKPYNGDVLIEKIKTVLDNIQVYVVE